MNNDKYVANTTFCVFMCADDWKSMLIYMQVITIIIRVKIAVPVS